MNRIEELEKKAIYLYLNDVEWDVIIQMLDKEEREEYWGLVNDR